MNTNFAGENTWEEATWKNEKRWKDNINMDLMATGCEDVRWMELAHDHVQ
jgi:hypothetical protein